MNPYVLLAKQAIEDYVKEGKMPSLPENLPEEFLKRKTGTFVTIMKNGNLRGCIGTYLPTKENVAEEIIANAIAVATEDYRFGPIQEEELPQLSYTVYILNEPELVKDIKELNPKKYGIIIKTIPITHPRPKSEAANGTDVVLNGHLSYKSGLLLPDLEGIDTREKQISIACQKGGIDPKKEGIIVYKFTVEKYR
jgi:AmmeMemoRadiSam system protein A